MRSFLPGFHRRRPALVSWLRLDRTYVEFFQVLAIRRNLSALIAAQTGRNELVHEAGEGVVPRLA